MTDEAGFDGRQVGQSFQPHLGGHVAFQLGQPARQSHAALPIALLSNPRSPRPRAARGASNLRQSSCGWRRSKSPAEAAERPGPAGPRRRARPGRAGPAAAGADLGPGPPVAELSIAQRQPVEIANALSAEARIVIPDGPTLPLAATETGRLLRVMQELRADGAGLVFITHRLHEVEAVADRVACLRNERLAGLLALIGGVTYALDPLFPSGANLLNMANLIGLSGISSIGQGLVIITRGMDRPVGAMFALLGVVFVDLLANHDAPWPLAVAAGGLALGAVHGPLGTWFRLQPFVVTLCGLLTCRGAAR